MLIFPKVVVIGNGNSRRKSMHNLEKWCVCVVCYDGLWRSTRWPKIIVPSVISRVIQFLPTWSLCWKVTGSTSKGFFLTYTNSLIHIFLQSLLEKSKHTIVINYLNSNEQSPLNIKGLRFILTKLLPWINFNSSPNCFFPYRDH